MNYKRRNPPSPSRYTKVGDVVKEGLSGVIYRYTDSKISSDVAMKTIWFKTKDNGLPSSVLREISVLKELKHENVVRLHDVRYTPEGFDLSFEWVGGVRPVDNLDNDLAEKMYDAPFESDQTKSFLSQILLGVCYCHSQKVLHRNLQPENVLLHPVTNTLKLSGFGLTKTFDAAPPEYSVNVGGAHTYKAPELMLNMQPSTPAVEMWSVGCIFAEMMTGQKLFGGNNALTVMDKIIRRLGVPSENEWPGVTAACTNIGLTDMDTLLSYPLPGLAEVFSKHEASEVDLLSRMLRLTPARRINAHDALQHPYFR